jgi:hypothetical protein
MENKLIVVADGWRHAIAFSQANITPRERDRHKDRAVDGSATKEFRKPRLRREEFTLRVIPGRADAPECGT